MLLLCQDFDIGETMRLWDTLLAAEGPADDGDNPMISADSKKVRRFAYLDFVVVAAVMNVRQKIVEGNDFATGMETLQKAAQKFRFRKPKGMDSDEEDEDDNDQIHTKIKQEKGFNIFQQDLTGMESLIQKSRESCICWMMAQFEQGNTDCKVYQDVINK